MFDNKTFVTIWSEADTVEQAAEQLSTTTGTNVLVEQVIEHARMLYRLGVVLREFLTGPRLLLAD